MASERRLRLAAVLAAGGIALLAFGAGALRGSPRLAVLCLLAALPLLAALWRSLERLAGARQAQAPQGAPGLPLEQQALVDNALALEARLEYTLVALFRIGGEGGQVAPLNANARKLVAPGRASDRPICTASWRRSREGGARWSASRPSAAPSARCWRCRSWSCRGGKSGWRP
jgi:hypothetical protein